MSSKIQIWNHALSLLGFDEPIISESEDSKPARLCRTNFEFVRDECLEDHYWNFALRRKELAESSTAPTWGYSKAFVIPSDVVRIRSINAPTNTRFKIENGFVLSDTENMEIQYISKDTDVSNYSPAFRSALAYKLAAHLAYPLTQSSTHMERLVRLATEKLRTARSLDGQADQRDDFVDNVWDDARISYGVDRGIDTDV